jgi:large subunit ribosomal protein L35
VPKIKSHKATSKRFRLSSGGKLRRMKLGKHLRRNKASRVVNTTDKPETVTPKGLRRRVKRLAPYLEQK